MADMATVLDAVAQERYRQDRQWGGPGHDDAHTAHDWLAYIVVFVGRSVAYRSFNVLSFRDYMIQVAALAVAAAEWADRRIDAGL